ncbi:hypothetical protein BDAP_001184 [Binucleata daphniae]
MDNTFHNAFSPIKNIKSIKQYEQEIDQLRNENFNLKSKITFLSHSAPTAQQSEEAKNYLNDAQLSYNILKDENKALKEENEMLRARICEDESMDLKEENLKIVKCVENLTKQHNEEKEKMINEKNILMNENYELKMKYENEINKAYNEKQEIQNKLNFELNKSMEKQKTQETQIMSLLNELENVKKYYNAEIQNINNEYTKKSEELKTKLLQYEIEIEKYKNMLEIAKNTENELNIKLMQCENELENYKNTQESGDNKSKLYNEKLKKIQDYANIIKQKNKEYTQQINEGNRKYDALQLECNQVNSENAILENELYKIKNEYEYVTKKMKSQSNDKENCNENEYTNYKKEMNKYNDKIKELKIKQIKYENEIESKNNEIKSKNMEIEKLKNEANNKNNEHEKLKMENSEINRFKVENNEIEKLKITNCELNDKIKTLQKDIIKLENDKSNLCIFNDELQNKLKLQFVEMRSIEMRMKNKEFLIKVLEEKNKNLEIREDENIKNSFEVSNLYKSNNKDRIKLLENDILLLRQNGTKIKHELEIERMMKIETNKQLSFFVATIEKIRQNVEKLKNRIKKHEKNNAAVLERYKQKIVNLQKKCKKECKKIIEPLTLIDKKNQDFIKNKFPGLNDLNEIIKKFASVYKTLNNKIDILEKENNQIASFVDNNNNKKTIELLEAFNLEFCSAKAELEFCKEYLKKKGNEIKEMRNMNRTYKNKIQEYEQKKEEKSNLRFFGSKPNFAT